MRTKSFIFFWAMIALASPCARASDGSELLVAQGDEAYRAGKIDAARARFADDVAADTDDASAAYALGLVLAKIGRVDEARASLAHAVALRPDFAAARRAAELLESRRVDVPPATRVRRERLGIETPPGARPWEVRGRAGIAYDSNPALESHDVHAHRDQAVFLLGAHARWDVVQRERALVRLDYDLSQSLLPDFGDFDFRAHRLTGTASWAPCRVAWVGIQGGYDHYSLGSRAYLQEPFVTPFVSFAEGDVGRTQLLYRHGEGDYPGGPFKRIRDGQTHTAAVNQLFLLGTPDRYVTLGYAFEREEPRRAAGNDWARDANQAHVGVGFPAWWRSAVELLYLYRNDDYLHRSSFAGFARRRDDDEHRWYAGVDRALGERVHATFGYRGVANRSNVGLFDYRRSVVALAVEVIY